jgi:hypothetical protein
MTMDFAAGETRLSAHPYRQQRSSEQTGMTMVRRLNPSYPQYEVAETIDI